MIKASRRMSHIRGKEIQCPCCYKTSRYRVTSNSFHCQIQCNHCYDQFLACPDSDCKYCVVNNKRALSYMKMHILSKKQKTSMSYTLNKPSTNDCFFNILKSVCPLCDVSFNNQTYQSTKKSGYLITATCHGEKKLQKHQCNLKKERFVLIILSPHINITMKHSMSIPKKNETILFLSSPTSNEVVEEDEESNIINFTTTDASSQNKYINNLSQQ